MEAPGEEEARHYRMRGWRAYAQARWRARRGWRFRYAAG